MVVRFTTSLVYNYSCHCHIDAVVCILQLPMVVAATLHSSSLPLREHDSPFRIGDAVFCVLGRMIERKKRGVFIALPTDWSMRILKAESSLSFHVVATSKGECHSIRYIYGCTAVLSNTQRGTV